MGTVKFSSKVIWFLIKPRLCALSSKPKPPLIKMIRTLYLLKKQNLYPKVMDIDSVTRKLRKAIIGFLGAVKANVLFIFSCWF